MIGSGKLGVQKILAIGDLSASQITSGGMSPQSNQSNSGSRISQHWTLFGIWTIILTILTLGW